MAQSDLDWLYRDDVVLDHNRNPRNPDRLQSPDVVADAVNPFCGDEIHLQLSFDDGGRISDVGYQGIGCAINRAAGSMLSEVIKGRTLEEAEHISEIFRDLMWGVEPGEERTGELGDLTSLTGVRAFPVRIKCALLAWSALEDGISERRRG